MTKNRIKDVSVSWSGLYLSILGSRNYPLGGSTAIYTFLTDHTYGESLKVDTSYDPITRQLSLVMRPLSNPSSAKLIRLRSQPSPTADNSSASVPQRSRNS